MHGARFVGADGQQRQAGRAELRPDIPEGLAFAEAGVGGKIDEATRRLDDEGARKGPVGIEEAARAIRLSSVSLPILANLLCAQPMIAAMMLQSSLRWSASSAAIFLAPCQIRSIATRFASIR